MVVLLNLSLDCILTVTQIMFYIVASVVAILTFRSARKGLLNTVNTEYYKKVLGKVEELSEELISEFDQNSPNYWIKNKGIEQSIERIHDDMVQNKKLILTNKMFMPGVPVDYFSIKLMNFVNKIKSDPFIPSEIRNQVVKHLEHRAITMQRICLEELNNYINNVIHNNLEDYVIAKAPVTDRSKLKPSNIYKRSVDNSIHIDNEAMRHNVYILENIINGKLYDNGCGVSQVEDEVHKIRLFIQSYFEKYNPQK